MSSKHSPTPWMINESVSQHFRAKDDDIDGSGFVVDADGNTVGPTKGWKIADRKRMMAMVNAHDDLVVALFGLSPRTDDGDMPCFCRQRRGGEDDHLTSCERARAALKKAGAL